MQTADQNPATLGADDAPTGNHKLLDSEAERNARERLFDEVLAAVELVLGADGAGFWREEPDHSLVLAASRSLPHSVLDAFDKHVTGPLQSIMQRWPESPLVAVPLNDPTNPIAEEIRAIADKEEIVGLAGVPCRIPGDMLGILLVVHRRPHPWTVRDLGLATGLAGQLATAMQNSRLYASVRSLANRLTAIHELSLRLTQLRDVDAIVDAIVGEVGRLVECDTVRVYRLDPRDGQFRPVAASGKFVGIDLAPLAALATGHAETLPGWVAKRNEPLIIPDASVERRSIVRSTFGPESLLLVPMAYGESVQGVLVVSKAGADRYGPEDEQALSIFGRYAAQAMVNATNIERLQEQHAILERQLAGERRLLDVSEKLVSTLDPRRVLEQIADTIGSVVRYDRLTIYRLDPLSGGIESVLSRTPPGDGEAAGIANPAEPAGTGRTGGADLAEPAIDEGLTSWVIGRGDAVCANDVGEGVLAVGPNEGEDLAALPAAPDGVDQPGERPGERPGQSVHSIIVVPLRVHGDVVGSLNLMRAGGPDARFSEHDFDLSKLFAGQASIALQNAEAHLTVASRADLDALTGLRNHGTFQRDLSALVEVGEPFSLLMMDLDSFKAFNDTYGHPAGDGLLQTVARAIVSAIRANDQAYRYGGDEFALLLLGASRTHAEEVASRVRATIREAVATSVSDPGGVPVGASVGAAYWPGDGPAKADLVRAADQALYQAKRARGELASADTERSRETTVDPLFAAVRDLMTVQGDAAIAATVLGHAVNVTGASDGFLSIGDEEMTQIAGVGRFEGAPSSLVRGQEAWGRAWSAGALVSADTVPADGSAERGARHQLGLPLVHEGRVVGVMGLVTTGHGASRRDNLKFLCRLSELAAIALLRAAKPDK